MKLLETVGVGKKRANSLLVDGERLKCRAHIAQFSFSNGTELSYDRGWLLGEVGQKLL